MEDYSNIKFPITLAEFTRMQRAEMHREPTLHEVELFREIVEMANEAYHAAAEVDTNTVICILNAITDAAEGNPELYHLAALFRGWAMKGMFEGAKALEKKLDSMK